MGIFTEPSNIEADSPDSMRPRSISEEPQDLIMFSDAEGPGPSFPPPHLAARFYKTRNNRRKSSAPSSRRNSLSSHHSNRSTRSAHGGPQSTHVAQHLRRASILETRKARLADQAAHAEKVRLRAAMVKAAPRLSTNSEERAAAAKQAREKFLAQVAANCAEEVRRAKRVAEDTREKKAAEHLKLKEDMEERLAEAERRRALYQQNQRRTRTINLPSVEEKKIIVNSWKPRTEEEAAKVIQKAWRNRQRRRVVHEFMQLGLTVENVRKTSFEETRELLGRKEVLNSTLNLLRFCGIQDGESGGSGETTAVRIFLSAFLILSHPSYVLGQEGVQEQDLIAKAENLLLSFGQIVSTSPAGPQFSPLSTQLAALAESYSSFKAAFTAWKENDSSVLVQTMLAQFMEFEAIWQTVKNNTEGDVAAIYREGIRKNQTQLLVSLKKLAGPASALKMIKDASRANRKSKSPKKPAGEAKPRAAPDTADPQSIPASHTSPASTTIPDQPSADPVSSHSQQLGWLTPASRRIQMKVPSNRVMIHELALNKDYRIDVESRLKVRDATVQTAVNQIREQLNSGIGDVWIVGMAATISEKLLSLVAPEHPLHRLIAETIDPKLIASQVKFGSFSYTQFFSFMNTVLPKLCAPVRDTEVKALAEDHDEDPVRRLAKLNFVIDLLSLDNANNTLHRHAPGIIKAAPQYEQNAFSKLVDKDPLERLQDWWSRAKTRAREEASRRGTTSPAIRVTPEKIYIQGFVDLAIAVGSLDDPDIPETLDLDFERMLRIRSNVLRMIIIGSILVTAKNLMKRDVRSQWKIEAQRMWELPYNNAQAFLSIIDTRHAMPTTTKNQLLGTINRVLVDAKAMKATDPVMKVLLQKLQTHVFTHLSASSAEDRIRAATTASEVLASSGLSEFVGQIRVLVTELARIGEVDRAAHGKWYDEASLAADAREANRNES